MRWSMIFRHEYLQLIYLRLNGYDDVKYRKKTTSYIPTVDTSLSCGICRAIIDSGIKCLLCNDPVTLQAMKVLDAPQTYQVSRISRVSHTSYAHTRIIGKRLNSHAFQFTNNLHS